MIVFPFPYLFPITSTYFPTAQENTHTQKSKPYPEGSRWHSLPRNAELDTRDTPIPPTKPRSFAYLYWKQQRRFPMLETFIQWFLIGAAIKLIYEVFYAKAGRRRTIKDQGTPCRS